MYFLRKNQLSLIIYKYYSFLMKFQILRKSFKVTCLLYKFLYSNGKTAFYSTGSINCRIIILFNKIFINMLCN